MTFDIYDSISGQMWFVEELGAAALAEDSDLFAEVSMKVQSGGGRDEGEDLALLVQQRIGWRRLPTGVDWQQPTTAVEARVEAS